MLLCYLRISRQRQQVAMLNATLEYNTSLVRMQHEKRENDSTKKFTKKTWPYRSVVEKVIRGKDAYLPCTRNVSCFWEKRKIITP